MTPDAFAADRGVGTSSHQPPKVDFATQPAHDLNVGLKVLPATVLTGQRLGPPCSSTGRPTPVSPPRWSVSARTSRRPRAAAEEYRRLCGVAQSWHIAGTTGWPCVYWRRVLSGSDPSRDWT